MSGKYQAYLEYKDSGVEWVGDIPVDWEMWKLSHAYREIGSGTTPPTTSDEWFGGDIPWVTTGELRETVINGTKKNVSEKTINTFSALRVYPAGSIAMAMYGATIGRLGIFGVDATTNQACCVMTASDVIDNKYLFYWLWAFRQDIINLSSGGGQPNINQEKVASLKISAPIIDEQTQIADFLDHETAKIDTLIEKQQQLIKLLKEKRQAVISHAVTKGLPSANGEAQAPMKDSGVEWLGEVPEHWNVKYLMHLVEPERRIMYGIVLPGPNVDKGVPIVKGGDVKPGRLTLESLCKTTFEIESKYERSRLKEGDIVYSIRGTIGDVEIVPKEIEGANLTQDAARIAPANGIDNLWLKYVLESTQVFSQLEVGSAGAAVKGINICDLKKAYIPVPPEYEMLEISNYLSSELNKLGKLAIKAEQQTALLKERRTALISAAVTGKIDVRNWRSPTTQAMEHTA
ncbi:restriction endonuclease subunit S [Vibrio vulnificus]|nr:restriction endonuclease subunit S [Vibrio vulnificus]